KGVTGAGGIHDVFNRWDGNTCFLAILNDDGIVCAAFQYQLFNSGVPIAVDAALNGVVSPQQQLIIQCQQCNISELQNRQHGLLGFFFVAPQAWTEVAVEGNGDTSIAQFLQGRQKNFA